jgi:signal transduction histidine kinase
MEAAGRVAYRSGMPAHQPEIEGRLLTASHSTVVDLAAAVAHEINNPLTAVLGYAELLLAELPADAPTRRELETIRDEAMRARDVVRALVAVATREPAR